MIWMFQRGNELVRLETSFDRGTDEYVVTITYTEQAPKTERYGEYDSFHARILALEEQLAADRWVQLGEPTILKDGWRGP